KQPYRIGEAPGRAMDLVMNQRGDRAGEQLAEKLSAIGGASQPTTETRMMLDRGHGVTFSSGREGRRGGGCKRSARSDLASLERHQS
ncbi:MAG: hypothetical protein ACKN94_08505, partial [Pirellulaceae bacterium]